MDYTATPENGLETYDLATGFAVLVFLRGSKVLV